MKKQDIVKKIKEIINSGFHINGYPFFIQVKKEEKEWEEKANKYIYLEKKLKRIEFYEKVKEVKKIQKQFSNELITSLVL